MDEWINGFAVILDVDDYTTIIVNVNFKHGNDLLSSMVYINNYSALILHVDVNVDCIAMGYNSTCPKIRRKIRKFLF